MKKKLELDLFGGIKRLKILTSRIVNTKFIGGYKSVFKGRGLEFEDYREYTPNDDASTIDWKASVKSNSLLVREFVEERNLNVYFLIDASSSMVYGSIDKLKMEYAGELIAALSYAVLTAGDSVGFALFDDKIIKDVPPAGGMVQYHNLVSTLVDPINYGGKYDLSEALKYTLAFLKEDSIIMVISDFIGLKNNWERYVKMISKKYDVIGVMVRDPRDMALPEYSSQVVLEDPFSNKHILVRPDLIRDDYKKYAARQTKLVKDVFLDAGANFIELATDKSFVGPITSLFIRRGRAKSIK